MQVITRINHPLYSSRTGVDYIRIICKINGDDDDIVYFSRLQY